MSSSTARFQAQHAELLVLAKVLVAELDVERITKDPNAARMALASFSGRLRVHAAMEQEALYPRLLASQDQEIASKARELESEISGLYDAFFAHLDKWTSTQAIAADASDFCAETTAILKRLGQRMRREDDELYPLVDRFDEKLAGAPFKAV